MKRDSVHDGDESKDINANEWSGRCLATASVYERKEFAKRCATKVKAERKEIMLLIHEW